MINDRFIKQTEIPVLPLEAGINTCFYVRRDVFRFFVAAVGLPL
jgi:hypothetical protein